MKSIDYLPTGNKMEKVCDLAHITLNKNAVFGDASALAPGGVRIGAPAMTSRGLKEADFEAIADFLHEALSIALEVQEEISSKTGEKKVKFVDFSKALEGNARIADLRSRVEAFATSFPMPGFNMQA